MAWYLEIFPRYRLEREAHSKIVLEHIKARKDAMDLVRQNQKDSILRTGLEKLQSDGYEQITVIQKNGEYLAVSVFAWDEYIDVRIHKVIRDKFEMEHSFLHAKRHDVYGLKVANIEIMDVLPEKSSGHGGLMLDALIQYAERCNVSVINQIVGELSPIDYKDHPDRLIHFYSKRGFTITDTADEYRKNICLSLESEDAQKLTRLIEENTKLQDKIKELETLVKPKQE